MGLTSRKDSGTVKSYNNEGDAMKRMTRRTKLIVAGLFGTALLGSCSCDTGARKDLPQENQKLDSSTATVALFPDKFPNVARKCDGTTGYRTTTDRNVWIVFNDPDCGGTGR